MQYLTSPCPCCHLGRGHTRCLCRSDLCDLYCFTQDEHNTEDGRPSQESFTYRGVFSQDSSLPDPPSPLSPSRYSTDLNTAAQSSPSTLDRRLCASPTPTDESTTLTDKVADPEVRCESAFSSPQHAARFHVGAVIDANSAALNVTPDISGDTLSNVDTILSSLPGPLPAGTCIILEPE